MAVETNAVASLARVVEKPSLATQLPHWLCSLSDLGVIMESEYDSEGEYMIQNMFGDGVGCDFCNKMIAVDDKATYSIMGYKGLHKKCAAALQSLHRIMQKTGNEQLRAQVDAARANEPLKFASIVNSLIAEKGQRSYLVRLSTGVFLEEMVSEESKSRDEKSVLFTNRQYVAWKMQNEGVSQQEALDMWAEDKLNVDVYKEPNKKGQLTIEVELPIEVVKSTKHINRQLSKRPLDDAGIDEHDNRVKGVLSGTVTRRPTSSPPAPGSQQGKPSGRTLSSIASDSENEFAPASKKSKTNSGASSHKGSHNIIPSKSPPSGSASKTSASAPRSKVVANSDDDMGDEDSAIAKAPIASDVSSAVEWDNNCPANVVIPVYEAAISTGQFYKWKKKVAASLIAQLGPYVLADKTNPINAFEKCWTKVKDDSAAQGIDGELRLVEMRRAITWLKDISGKVIGWKQSAAVVDYINEMTTWIGKFHTARDLMNDDLDVISDMKFDFNK